MQKLLLIVLLMIILSGFFLHVVYTNSLNNGKKLNLKLF